MGHALLGATRTTLTAGFLAFGLWSALPSLMEMQLPAPFALPTPVTAAQPVGPAPVRVLGTTTLSLTDRDLTRAAEPYFPRAYSGVTVSSPVVRVTSGRIVLTATARSLIGTGQLVASATPTAADGRLVVRVDSVTVSGLPLPDGMKADVGQQLQTAIDAYTGTRIQVTQVTAGAGIVTLKGTAVP